MGNRAAKPPQVQADDQSSGHLPHVPIIISGRTPPRTLEACEREMIHYKAMAKRLRAALNDLQMTISLLSLQSRGSTNAEAASQLAVAANRVAMIARIHHRLNSYEGVQTIEFKKFLEDFGCDFSAMVSSHERPEQVVVEGIEINLPVATVIPLGFIASELITNAAKHGKSRITIRLEPDPEYGHALSVSNDGPALPVAFDPGASTGLGMRIIQSFVRQIGGALRSGRGDDGQGARFTVRFP